MTTYRAYFGLKADPFATDVATKDLMRLPGMLGVKERLDYVISLGGVLVVTGEVGSGKSTSLRWSLAHYHASEVHVVAIVANTGSIVELLRLISWGFDLNPTTMSKSKLFSDLRAAVREIAGSRKQRLVLVIDEANLLRHDVVAELHTLLNFDHDSKSFLPLVLCGQATLIDRLAYRGAAPLASRVIAKAHLETLTQAQMEDYVAHHVKIAGGKRALFDPAAVTAIHQGSGGVLRRANALARGGLLAAQREEKDAVTAEHIRIASSELM
jgi:type II secretory pathway predicted ATPase ExeA